MSRLTTLCYLEDGDRYLLLHRVKKEQDENHGKWIGLGGKLEAGKSPIAGNLSKQIQAIKLQKYS